RGRDLGPARRAARRDALGRSALRRLRRGRADPCGRLPRLSRRRRAARVARRARSPALIVGLDVGTTGVKALAVSADGEVVARASREYPLSTPRPGWAEQEDRKSTRLNSSHVAISYAVFCLKKKKQTRVTA